MTQKPRFPYIVIYDTKSTDIFFKNGDGTFSTMEYESDRYEDIFLLSSEMNLKVIRCEKDIEDVIKEQMNSNVEEEESNNWITPSKVRDGQIVIVRFNSITHSHNGRLLQRVGDLFFTIGEGDGKTYRTLHKCKKRESFLVEVLENGTELVIEDNQ